MSGQSVRPRRRMAADGRLLLLIASAALGPALLAAMELFDVTAGSRLATGLLAAGSALWTVAVAVVVRRTVLHHVRTLGSLIEAARLQDYAFRGAHARESGELAELYGQINTLTQRLKAERQGEQELLAVLERIVSEIDVGIVVCDCRDQLRMLNMRACALLRHTAEELVGADFADTPLASLPLQATPTLVDHRFPGGEGRWQISQQFYRHLGRPSRIVFITDVKQILSAEETSAWQRLIRVISHEVNNTLTPIISLCQTISNVVNHPDGSESSADVRDGLAVISERARGLKAFITAYARVARLPEPEKVLFPAARLLEHARGMFGPDRLEIAPPDPGLMLFGDPIHLEQLLINLVRNGLEASRDTTEPVRIRCQVQNGQCLVEVIDGGCGIRNPGNLFVPFYTTKRDGAGIGLVLCRQIAALHHAQVSVRNRADAAGAVATLTLPLPAEQMPQPGRRSLDHR
jgi:two-component system, NtrC family, nitrogen regulation sensor histidine kinase NtrY